MLIILFLLLLAILQIAFLPYFKIFGVFPNIVLVFLIFNIYKNYKEEGVSFSLRTNGPTRSRYSIFGGRSKELKNFLLYPLFVGLLLDFFSGLPLGLVAISLIITIFLIFLIFHIFLRYINFYILYFLIGIATIIFNLLVFIFNNFFVLKVYQSRLFEQILSLQFLQLVCLELFYNVFISIIIYYVIRRFRKILY